MMRVESRCIVVEDQPPAQRLLARYIADTPQLALAGMFATAAEAALALDASDTDLLFLDVNLPGMNGLDLLRSLRRPPRTIVTSAEPQHAVAGFDLDVCDYLVKPFSFDRFLRAVARARRDTRDSYSKDEPALRDHVFVRAGSEMRRIELADLGLLRAEGDYVALMCAQGGRHFISSTLSWWDERLPRDKFVRVHKSYIVNLAFVHKITGDQLHTTLGLVPLGRTYRDRIRALCA